MKKRTIWIKKKTISQDYLTALILLVVAVVLATSFIIFNYYLLSIVPIFFAMYTFVFLVNNAFVVEKDVPEEYIDLSELYSKIEEIKINDENDNYEKKVAFWTD